MKTESERPDDFLRGTGNAAHTRSEQGLPSTLLWLGAGVAMVLVVWSVVMRWQQPGDLSLVWGVAANENAAGTSAIAIDQPEAVHLELLQFGPVASLDALGKTLDDPHFGQLSGQAGLDPHELVPNQRRWQFIFAAGLTEGQYRGHLAALDAEIGIVSTAGSIEYVTGWSGTDVKRRIGSWKDEKRPYWSWGHGDLRQAEVILLKNAGIQVGDEILLHFLPDVTVDQLQKLERDFAGREERDILRTQFAWKRTFRGYEIYVFEQEER